MSNSFKQVGNTPLIKLKSVEPNVGASIWLKVESGNPSGSYKDRMAISVIGEALKRGELTENQTVVEYTGGSTGSALAFACACSGIKFTAIFSDAFSEAKQRTMETLGADVIEKHINIDRKFKKNDYYSSLNINELEEFIEFMHSNSQALGESNYKIKSLIYFLSK